MVTAARRVGRLDDLDLHALEPSSYTFGCLSEKFRGSQVKLAQIALSERTGSSTLHVTAPGAGSNSLHSSPGASAYVATEQVVTTTLDAYADRFRLDTIALIKIDTEGHDLAVLRGAHRLLAENRITIAQFEYNHRWVDARSFLRDAFELLVPLGYHIGKLTPRGVEFYPRWDAELETFIEGNYVACTPAAARSLPAIAWWKSVRG